MAQLGECVYWKIHSTVRCFSPVFSIHPCSTSEREREIEKEREKEHTDVE